MSAQFGIWNFDGRPIDPTFLAAARASLLAYDLNRTQQYDGLGISICCVPSQDGPRFHRERVTPCLTPSGAVVAWDGRLDNRTELVSELRTSDNSQLTDAAIAAMAFHRWGKDSLKKLLGDWSLSVWDPTDRTLLLAKDFLGS